MKDIHVEQIPEFDPSVQLDAEGQMTPSLQNIFQRNTGFQGYMWVPALVQSSALDSGTYWFNLRLPNAKLELTVKAMNDSAVPHAVFYSLYRGGVAIAEDINMGVGDSFLELADYIVQIPKSTSIVQMKAYQDTLSLYPFTVFYRIRGD